MSCSVYAVSLVKVSNIEKLLKDVITADGAACTKTEADLINCNGVLELSVRHSSNFVTHCLHDADPGQWARAA